MILVTGATGNVGWQVVQQLRAAGEAVRALSRHPERAGWPEDVEGVAGDLAEGLPDDVFDGVSGLYLFPVPDRVEDTVRAAAAAGVGHVVVLSSLAVEVGAGGPLERRHRDVEVAVERSGVSWTHVRPGMFMTNTLGWAGTVRSEGVVRQPYGGSTAAPVHEADIAAVAVAALLDPERHAGAAYALTGPEALSQLDRTRILGEVLGRSVRFEEQGREEARAAMLASPWMSAPLADSLLDMLAGSVGVTEGAVLTTTADVLGRPPRTFAAWVEDHRAAFTAA